MRAPTTGPRTMHRRSLIAALHLLCLLLLGLHLYVRTLPPTPTPIPEPGTAESLWWGLWPATYPPIWAILLGIALILLSLIAAWRAELSGKQILPPSSPPLLTTAAVVLVLAFYAFPIVHTRWGDAYMLSKAIAWPEEELRLTHSWQAPLDVYLHGLIWRTLNPVFGWQDAAPVYRWLSPLAGILYLTAALALSRERSFAPAGLTFAALASLGTIQLFFGYIENYSFAAALILIYLWLAVAVLRGEKPLWAAAIVLAFTHAIHPSTIILAPSLLYIAWYRLRNCRAGNKSSSGNVLSTAAQVVLPMLAVAAATVALMESGGHGIQALLTTDRPGGGDASWFVPLWQIETRWQHYTMFSWPHLRDQINEHLLVAPVILPSLLLIWVVPMVQKLMGAGLVPARLTDAEKASSIQDDAERATGIFLTIATLCYLLFIFVWNPDYGGQRDWDLFSLAFIPLAVLWVYTLARRLDRHALAAGIGPLLLLQSLHTAAWIYQNTLSWDWP